MSGDRGPVGLCDLLMICHLLGLTYLWYAICRVVTYIWYAICMVI